MLYFSINYKFEIFIYAFLQERNFVLGTKRTQLLPR
jgi:hypothetical protein